jgi:hypothetical protein
VGREGIEPSTNGLRGGFGQGSTLVNQKLAALAKLEINLIKAQFRHTQSGFVTNSSGDRHASRVGLEPRLERAQLGLRERARSANADKFIAKNDLELDGIGSDYNMGAS